MKFYLFGDNGRAIPGHYATAEAARADLAQNPNHAVINERDVSRILAGTVRMPGDIERVHAKRLTERAA